MRENDRPSTTSARKRFLELLCSNVSALFMLVIVCIILFVLSAISFFYVEPGTASYVLLQIDLALIVGFLALLGALIYRCSQFRP